MIRLQTGRRLASRSWSEAQCILGLVLMSLVPIGCGKEPMAPSPSTAGPTLRSLVPPTTPNALVSYSSGGQITIVAEDGTQYTLYVDQREIHSSNGEILMLDAEQMDYFLPEFLGTVEADLTEPGLANISPDGCVPTEFVVCPLGVSLQSTDLSLIQWQFAPLTETKSRKPSKHPKLRNEFSGNTPLTLNSWDPMCTQVANAALPSTIDWRGQRTSFIQVGFTVGVAVVAGGVLKKALLPFSTGYVMVAGMAADRFNARTRMNILAFYWNSYFCGTQTVYAGPVWMRGTGSGGGGGSSSCGYETISISFNGGSTWSLINVLVCYTY